MDTHVSDNTLIPPLSTRRPDMALPGEEGELPPNSPAAASAPAAPPRKSRRGVLLGSAAVVAVLVVGAGVFLISPYNTVLPLGVQNAVATARASAGNSVRHAAEAVGLMAPAAQMASAPPPATVPAPAIREPAPRTSREAQLDEIMAYRQRQAAPDLSRQSNTAGQPRPEPLMPAADRRSVEPTPLARRLGDAQQAEPAPLARRVDEPPRTAEPARQTDPPTAARVTAMPVAPASAVAPPPSIPAVVAAPAPALVAQVPVDPAGSGATVVAAAVPLVVVPPPTPATPAPPDPVAVAASLRPAPMSTPQQVDVLGLVTQMAVIMRNREERDRQMQADLAAMREQLEAANADFGRRLALAEARGAMNAAMGAAAAPPPVQTSASPPPVLPAQAAAPAAARTPTSAAPTQAANDGTRRRYRVQAASPGLAMLSEVDRTGEGGAQLQVAVGDEVSGYGKITAIAQQGSNWVVRAERGTIQ
ncbi:hypothetical protein D9599_18060 [Roseomonas sp. KE2513]|uniref:hypothetical protein n=1 Tax=Roseomonas sp. KE2513 TaxID=2479202 RepID=UPI0018E05BEC|nr:hypothetical protein [Roseomonas sp. KE2513]MBI0537467.1 hypothetical protein [Roseomonas sp. KE2513]